MKRKLKIICSAALICAAVTLLTACAKWDTPYKTLDKEGYTVSIQRQIAMFLIKDNITTPV